MHDELVTLAYISRNAISENGADMIDEVGDILASARKNNPARGITGALLFNDNCFAQVLEGPSEAVDAAYQMIVTDTRHRDLILLHRDGLKQRYFPDWSMAFATADPQDADLPDLDGELTTQAAAHDRAHGRELALVLYDLMRRRAREAGDLSWVSLDDE